MICIDCVKPAALKQLITEQGKSGNCKYCGCLKLAVASELLFNYVLETVADNTARPSRAAPTNDGGRSGHALPPAVAQDNMKRRKAAEQTPAVRVTASVNPRATARHATRAAVRSSAPRLRAWRVGGVAICRNPREAQGLETGSSPSRPVHAQREGARPAFPDHGRGAPTVQRAHSPYLTESTSCHWSLECEVLPRLWQQPPHVVHRTGRRIVSRAALHAPIRNAY